jgi:hypothetical protein
MSVTCSFAARKPCEKRTDKKSRRNSRSRISDLAGTLLSLVLVNFLRKSQEEVGPPSWSVHNFLLSPLQGDAGMLAELLQKKAALDANKKPPPPTIDPKANRAAAAAKNIAALKAYPGSVHRFAANEWKLVVECVKEGSCTGQKRNSL